MELVALTEARVETILRQLEAEADGNRSLPAEHHDVWTAGRAGSCSRLKEDAGSKWRRLCAS